MNKKVLFFITAIAIVSLGLYFFKDGDARGIKSRGSQTILFYGSDCPHCARLEDFIKENHIDEKISFQKKEVSRDQNNVAELLQKAKQCGLPAESILVPFLWDGSRCLVGGQEIIDFFQQRISQK